MKTGKLEIKLINYFLLIAFAAMLIGMEFFFEINHADLTMEIYDFTAQQKIDPETGKATINTITPLVDLRNKIVMMFGVLTVVVAIVLTMFVKHITIPLCKIAEVARRINEGDLSQIIQIDSQDEIGQVGEAINELTSNFQEVATFTASTVNHTIDDIEMAINDIEANRTTDLNKLKDIKNSIVALSDFVNTLKILQPDRNITR